MDKIHKPNINVGAGNIIRNALGGRWAEEPADYYNAGSLLENELEKLPKAPTFENPTAFSETDVQKHDAWANAEFVFELTESERDTVKKCLVLALKQKQLPIGRYTNIIIKTFGLLGK